MKRPLAVIGITYLTSQAAAVLLGSRASLIIGAFLALCALCYLLFIWRKRAFAAVMLITASAALLVSGVYTELSIRPLEPLSGQTVYIRGQICELPERVDERYVYIVNTSFIGADGIDPEIKLRLTSSYDLSCQCSDIIEGEVTVSRLRSLNDGGMRLSLLSKGIVLNAYAPRSSDIEVSKGEPGLYSRVISLRVAIRERINRFLGSEVGPLMCAMLTGDRSELPEKTAGDMRVCGLSHLLAVSGLHMSLLAYALTRLLRIFLVNRRIAAAAVIPLIVFMMLLTGLSLSAMRAGIMTIISLLAVIVKRESDPINSLGAAVLCICLSNPFASVDAGLLLSFSSTLALLVLAPKTSELIGKHVRAGHTDRASLQLRRLLRAISIPVIASASIIPIVSLYFGEVSVISPLSNLLLVAPSMLMLVLAAAAVVLSFLGSIGAVLAYPLFALVWLLGKGLLLLSSAHSSIPGASISGGESLFVVFVLIVLLAAACFLVYREDKKHLKRSIKITFILCSVLALSTFWAGELTAERESVTVLDSGSGAAILARSDGVSLLVCDCSDSYYLRSIYYELRERGITELSILVLPNKENSKKLLSGTLCTGLSPRCCLADGVSGSDLGNTASAGKLIVSEHGGWVSIFCGELNVLLCPEECDLAACPFDARSVDCAVIRGNSVANIQGAGLPLAIISADYEEGMLAAGYTRAKGVRNVFCTAESGSLLLEKDGIYVKIVRCET